MTKKIKFFIFLIRVSSGWLLFYAGITKVLDSSWSAAGYLNNATTLSDFYAALAAPNILPVVNILNEWGLILLGASLILGLFTRFSGVIAASLMLLYYFPVLDFPKIGETSFIVDEHIIYALVFVFLSAVKAGRFWGLDGRRRRW